MSNNNDKEVSFQFADNNYDISVIMYPIAQKEITNGNYHQVYSCYLQNNNYNTGFTFELTYSMNHDMKPSYQDIADTLHMMLSDYQEYNYVTFPYYITSRYSTEDIKFIGMDELSREYTAIMYQCDQIKSTLVDHNEDINHIIDSLWNIVNADE